MSDTTVFLLMSVDYDDDDLWIFETRKAAEDYADKEGFCLERGPKWTHVIEERQVLK